MMDEVKGLKPSSKFSDLKVQSDPRVEGQRSKVDIFFSKRSKRLCSFSWRKKKEPKEHPPYQASPIWEDVIDYGQEPPFVKVLV